MLARHVSTSFWTLQPNDLIRRYPMTLCVPRPPETNLLEEPQLFWDDVEQGLSLPLSWHLPQVTSEHWDYNKVWSSLYTEGAETINALASLILLVFDLLPGRHTLHCRIIFGSPDAPECETSRRCHREDMSRFIVYWPGKKGMVSFYRISDVGANTYTRFIYIILIHRPPASQQRCHVNKIQEVLLLLLLSSFITAQGKSRNRWTTMRNYHNY